MHAVSHHKEHTPYSTAMLVRVSNWLELHPKAFGHAMRAMLVVLVGFTLINTGIFTLQNSRTPIFTKINGKSYSNMSFADAKQKLVSDFAGQTIAAKIGNSTQSLNAVQSGVQINAEKTLSSITNRSGWKRVPLIGAVSNLFRGPQAVYEVNNEILSAKLAPLITPVTIMPKDATAIIPADANQFISFVESEKGTELTAETAAEAVEHAVSNGSFVVEIAPKVLEPKWSKLDIEKFTPAINAARQTSLTLDSGKEKLVLTPQTLAPMLKINGDGNALKMTLDTTALQAYLDRQANLFYEAPIATKTVQQDGKEVARTEGAPGKQLDTTATAKAATVAFENGVLNVVPALAALTPEVLVTKTYSNTNDGLYRIIDDFAKSHAGVYRVAAVELNGSGNRSAFYNADTQVITASTYKLFVAYGVLQKIEKGEWTMNTATASGTVGDCMYKMIHISDNTCADTLEKQLGYKSFDTQMRKDGFTSTNLLNSTGDKHSTARDEMTLVTKLYNHELLNESSTEYLFGLMKSQIYRQGIPAGSNGSVVADKVGMLYALNHDIGVVYAPKSTYALVIMTDGAGGWNNVKLLSGQIYDFYNQ